MVKSQLGATNIFNITDSVQYRCQVHHYHSRVSRLYLRVYKGQTDIPVFYLLFSDVAYFDCPVNWQGANFSIAPADDCIALMLEAGLIGQAILQFPDAYASITEYARLYVAKSNAQRPVKIIANSANMVKSLPTELA
ncbi:MAG: hypothetical protein Q9P01_01720 [Anaerolineae bacterium]|nr:hypothetical protein [Anaerolineae bacterium]MDQ7033580.1 hypothetical protein [Anaerolineae bacterium]